MARKKNPDGTLNAYEIRPDEVKDGDLFGYKIVAKAWEGWDGWCAFRGPTDWTDERVAAEGDEIPEPAARLLFHALANTSRAYANS